MKCEPERLAGGGLLGWWRLRRQSAKAGWTTSEHANAVAPSVDYSLRSSGKTYINHASEAQRIVDRIKTSSASVIGIAGVRGAGKSSLAKKVLDQCNTSGFFTLLIPSPTGYEPREFLLAIFQRIAEHAYVRTQTIIEAAESLTALGARRAHQLRRQLLVIVGGLLLFSLAVPATYIVTETLITNRQKAEIATEVSARLATVSKEIDRRRSLSITENAEIEKHAAEADKKQSSGQKPYWVLELDLPSLELGLRKLSKTSLEEIYDGLLQFARKRGRTIRFVRVRASFFPLAF